jgi:flagellar P-ring protein FlgI
MHASIRLAFGVIVLLGVIAAPAFAARLKDVVDLQGVRSNQLQGYGIIVGLNGTGDTPQAAFTPQSVLNMLKRRGVVLDLDPAQLRVKNVAAVIVTANLPPFARQGQRLDVQVSSLGDCKSLQGGTLLMSPLFAPDGQVYAVAQGAVSLGGGFAASAAGASATKSHPTAGMVPSGASVEKDVEVPLGADGQLLLTLHQPDFTTAKRISDAINGALGRGASHPVDATTVAVAMRGNTSTEAVELATQIERLEVNPDNPARVVMNERTGTVIIGEDVRILPVAIAHGSLQVTVKTDLGVSQPAPFSEGQTVVVPDSTIKVEEGNKNNLAILRAGVNLRDLVGGLNALGVTPQDLIAILQAIKAAGALEANLELM